MASVTNLPWDDIADWQSAKHNNSQPEASTPHRALGPATKLTAWVFQHWDEILRAAETCWDAFMESTTASELEEHRRLCCGLQSVFDAVVVAAKARDVTSADSKQAPQMAAVRRSVVASALAVLMAQACGDYYVEVAQNIQILANAILDATWHHRQGMKAADLLPPMDGTAVWAARTLTLAEIARTLAAAWLAGRGNTGNERRPFPPPASELRKSAGRAFAMMTKRLGDAYVRGRCAQNLTDPDCTNLWRAQVWTIDAFVPPLVAKFATPAVFLNHADALGLRWSELLNSPPRERDAVVAAWAYHLAFERGLTEDDLALLTNMHKWPGAIPRAMADMAWRELAPLAAYARQRGKDVSVTLDTRRIADTTQAHLRGDAPDGGMRSADSEYWASTADDTRRAARLYPAHALFGKYGLVDLLASLPPAIRQDGFMPPMSFVPEGDRLEMGRLHYLPAPSWYGLDLSNPAHWLTYAATFVAPDWPLEDTTGRADNGLISVVLPGQSAYPPDTEAAYYAAHNALMHVADFVACARLTSLRFNTSDPATGGVDTGRPSSHPPTAEQEQSLRHARSESKGGAPVCHPSPAFVCENTAGLTLLRVALRYIARGIHTPPITSRAKFLSAVKDISAILDSAPAPVVAHRNKCETDETSREQRNVADECPSASYAQNYTLEQQYFYALRTLSASSLLLPPVWNTVAASPHADVTSDTAPASPPLLEHLLLVMAAGYVLNDADERTITKCWAAFEKARRKMLPPGEIVLEFCSACEG